MSTSWYVSHNPLFPPKQGETKQIEMEKTYRIIDSSASPVYKILITEEGAKILWDAYETLFGKNCQTMERREERGGVCHLSEIDYFKSRGALRQDFNYKDYEITKITPSPEDKQ